MLLHLHIMVEGINACSITIKKKYFEVNKKEKINPQPLMILRDLWEVEAFLGGEAF